MRELQAVEIEQVQGGWFFPLVGVVVKSTVVRGAVKGGIGAAGAFLGYKASQK